MRARKPTPTHTLTRTLTRTHNSHHPAPIGYGHGIHEDTSHSPRRHSSNSPRVTPRHAASPASRSASPAPAPLHEIAPPQLDLPSARLYQAQRSPSPGHQPYQPSRGAPCPGPGRSSSGSQPSHEQRRQSPSASLTTPRSASAAAAAAMSSDRSDRGLGSGMELGWQGSSASVASLSRTSSATASASNPSAGFAPGVRSSRSGSEGVLVPVLALDRRASVGRFRCRLCAQCRMRAGLHCSIAACMLACMHACLHLQHMHTYMARIRGTPTQTDTYSSPMS